MQEKKKKKRKKKKKKYFFFNDTATTEIYTLSLHDALPISGIMGDPTLLKQAFMNLFLTAIQAMEDGGEISVE